MMGSDEIDGNSSLKIPTLAQAARMGHPAKVGLHLEVP
jgi:hypothetical protein